MPAWCSSKSPAPSRSESNRRSDVPRLFSTAALRPSPSSSTRSVGVLEASAGSVPAWCSSKSPAPSRSESNCRFDVPRLFSIAALRPSPSSSTRSAGVLKGSVVKGKSRGSFGSLPAVISERSDAPSWSLSGVRGSVDTSTLTSSPSSSPSAFVSLNGIHNRKRMRKAELESITKSAITCE